jgi:RNA polymerase sigma factor (sigma-70 family)
MNAADDEPESPNVNSRQGASTEDATPSGTAGEAEQNPENTYMGVVSPRRWVVSISPGDWSRLVDYVHSQARLSVEDSEDLVQQALADISTGDLDPDEPVEDMLPWVAAILRFRSLHVLRYLRRFEELSTDQPVPNVSGPFAAAEMIQLREDLKAALLQLPADQREAVVLHDCCGWSDAEIADLVGVSPATIRQRRAVDDLQRVALRQVVLAKARLGKGI